MLFRYSRSRSPAPPGPRGIHQPLLKSEQHQLRAIACIELAQQAGDAVLHRVDRQMKFGGDGLIVEAFAQAAQQIFLPQAEPLLLWTDPVPFMACLGSAAARR